MVSRTTPMLPVDAAWYHIDGPANLAMVTGILLTREPLDFARVRDVLLHRLARFDRFRRRVVETGLPIPTPHWQEVEAFDIDQHVHHIGLPAPHDQRALLALVSDLASTPLDRDLPLWQAHVVDDVEGGSAFVLRFHHCMGDGTAMMAVVGELFDTEPGAPLEREARPAAPDTSAAPDAPGASGSAFLPAFETVERSARAVLSTISGGAGALLHPGTALEKAGLVADGVAMLVNELLKAPDPKSPLKGEFGLQKRVAWSEPVPLDDIRRIGACAGAKVNDVLVAALTGALRTYFGARGVETAGHTLRAIVPVDLHQRTSALELGNDFGLVILELAIDVEDPLERLQTTKARMDALKRSPEAAAIRVLFDIVGRGPKIVEDLAVDLFGSKASLVLTNVAGPREALYLAGVPIERLMFFVPHPGRQLGMGVSILSYRGAVSLMVAADAHLVPDPERVTAEFTREVRAMLTRAARRRPASRRRGTSRKRRGTAGRSQT